MGRIKKQNNSQCNEVKKETNTVKELANSSNLMHLLLNDPATPELYITSKLVGKPRRCPSFKVAGFQGASNRVGTDAWRAAQVYCTFLNALHTIQPANASPIEWARTRQLVVMPDAGKDLNAYYDGRSLRFFKFPDPQTKKMVYTGESVDIVAHEMGHALLDAIRPDLWNLQALEVWSYHEAWSDIVAVLTIMKYEHVVNYALKETNGDLMKASVITRLAEEMGNTLYKFTKGKDGRKPGALREANNSFVYTNPKRLPKNAPDNKLAAECHSFGRVFLGAFYEIISKVYKFEKENGYNDTDAARRTRSMMSKLLTRASKLAPATPRFYYGAAQTMLSLDKKWGGRHQHILESVFKKRKLLGRRGIKALSKTTLDDVDLDNSVVEECGEEGKVVRVQSTKTTKLNEHFSVRSQKNNPLYDCEVELANESYLDFDGKGNLVSSLSVPESTSVESARACVNYIYENDMYQEGLPEDGVFDKQFSIVDGKLVRNFFV